MTVPRGAWLEANHATARGAWLVPLQDSSFALFFNASEVTAECLVPGRTAHTRWRLVLDTAAWPPAAEPVEMAAGVTRTVQPRSLVVLQEVGGRQSW